MNADNISSEEIRVFVGPNAIYYIHQFSKFNISGTEKYTLSWNWSSCGFTFVWMLYRKMYIQALITFVIFCIPGMNFIVHIVAGVAGNYIYYRHVKERIVEIKAIQSPLEFYPVLKEVGGVHKWAVFVTIIVGIILVILVILFFASITTSIERSGVLSI
jgi:hypothetical protein